MVDETTDVNLADYRMHPPYRHALYFARMSHAWMAMSMLARYLKLWYCKVEPDYGSSAPRPFAGEQQLTGMGRGGKMGWKDYIGVTVYRFPVAIFVLFKSTGPATHDWSV